MIDIDAALIERRRELVDELARIDEALKPITAGKPRANRSPSSVSSRVEAFVKTHPDCRYRDVAAALNIAQSGVSSALYALVRAGRLTRSKPGGMEWQYRAGRAAAVPGSSEDVPDPAGAAVDPSPGADAPGSRP